MALAATRPPRAAPSIGNMFTLVTCEQALPPVSGPSLNGGVVVGMTCPGDGHSGVAWGPNVALALSSRALTLRISGCDVSLKLTTPECAVDGSLPGGIVALAAAIGPIVIGPAPSKNAWP